MQYNFNFKLIENNEQFNCAYPLKVQACPPRDQTLAPQSRVSGQDIVGAVLAFPHTTSSMSAKVCQNMHYNNQQKPREGSCVPYSVQEI